MATVRILLVLSPILPEALVKAMEPAEMVPLVSVILPEPLALKVTLVEPEILLMPMIMLALLALVSRVTEVPVTFPARERLLLSRIWKALPAEEVAKEAAPELLM